MDLISPRHPFTPWSYLPFILSPPHPSRTLPSVRTSYDHSDVAKLIEQLASRISSAFQSDKPLNIVGIRTRGEVLAKRLEEILRAKGFAQIGRGVLDITLY